MPKSVEVLASKANDLSSIPASYMEDGENQVSQLSVLHMYIV